ncbi:WSC domain-containing protein [Collybia nuda]|uniref:WSC domain-containing protein n=1 Tax=Collybia nuda TaxID=64659 RepID=A0A9P6CH71_9AGAR|nr:WSC domain-containing protein [Collybia nuda]
MTVESCLAFCTDAGTHYAGVENGNVRCDFAIQNPGVPAEDTECNVPCVGDPLETCGAGGRMNMYYDGTPDPIAVPAVDTWAYQGCFKDSAAARTLLQRLDGPGPITPEQCTTSCKAAGFTFAGFEFSLECWCGPELTNPILVDDSDCKMACAGDHTAFCGGSNRISIYKDTPEDPDPTTTADPTPTPTDPTTTDTPTPTDPTTTPTDPTTEPTPTPTDPTTDPVPTTTEPDPEPTTTDPTDPEPTTTEPTEPTTTDPTDPEPTEEPTPDEL